MNTPIRILCLEDNKNDVELTRAILQQDGIDCILTHVETQDQFFNLLQTENFDIILSDYMLPGFTGIEVFRLIKQRGFEIPFIIVSGSLGEAVAIESLKEGVTDYVLKDNLKRLAPAIRRAMDEKNESRRRKQAEEELVKKEHLLSESQRIAHIGSWTYDMAGNITWTEETYRIYGIAPDTFIPDANSFINLIHPDDRTAMQNWIDRYVVGEKPGELEFRIVSPDGSVRYLRGQGEINYDAENKPFYLTGTVQDITERKRAAEEITRIASFPQVNPNPIIEIDATGHILYANPAAIKLLPNIAAEGFTHPWLANLEALFTTFQESSKKPTTREVKIGESWYTQTFYRVVETQCLRIYGYNITERKRAEEALHLQSEIMKNVTEGIYLIRLEDGIIVYANPKFEDMFGYDPGEMIGKEVSIVNAPDEKTPEETKEEIVEILKNTGEWHGEVKNIKKDGTHFYCYANVSTFDHPEYGRVIVSVHTDITERKLAEEKIRTSREQLRGLAGHLQIIREDERTAIAREIHDELGQSLTGMKIDLSWIKSKLRKDQPALTARAEELNGLIDSLIQNVRRISSQLRPGILDDFGLIAAIEWQVQEFQRRTKIKSKFITNVESIDLDKSCTTALFRIVQESLTNVVRHAHATQVSIDVEVDVNEITLRITDNGRGITSEEIADIESLGLLGMKERVHLIGGMINFVRNESGGTSVVVTVPIVEHAKKVIES